MWRNLLSSGLWLVGIVLSVPALAQHVSSSIGDDGAELAVDGVALEASSDDRTYLVNIEDCRDILDGSEPPEFRFSWTFRRAPASDDQWIVKIARPGDTCNFNDTTEDGSGDHCEIVGTLEDMSGAGPYRVTVDAEEFFESADPETCYSSETRDTKVGFIFSRQDTTGTTDDGWDYDQIEVAVDTLRPSAPSGLTSRAGEDAIDVEWEDTAGDSDEYVVYVATDMADFDGPPEEWSGTRRQTSADASTTVTEGVSVGNTYYVAVTIEDSATGNESEFSEVIEVSTQPATDFFELYRQNGGTETGGYCAVAPASRPGPLGFVFLAALLALRRFRARRDSWSRAAGGRTWVAVPLGLALLLPATASAGESDRQSPISGVFGLKFGHYTPQIDDGQSNGPYETIFGERNPLYLEAEYMRELYRGIGSAGVGGGLGWHRVRDNALLEDGTIAADETQLLILPVRLSGTYRFDYLLTRWSVPVVPAFQFGADYYLWSVRSGGKPAEFVDEDGESQRARGATTGWHWSASLHLLLDAIAPNMGRAFDGNWGVNGSYLFVEYTDANVSDFGGEESWNLSDQTLLFGIDFEF